MTVHRVQAGVLDATGWSSASSTSGDFAVRLPCLFDDFSLQAAASELVMGIDAIGCLRLDQRKYSASRFKYRTGTPTARNYFEQMSGTQRWEGETARRRIVLNGFPALQVEFQSSSRCGTLQAVLVGPDLLTLTAEAPRSACEGLVEQAASFFSSLRVNLREPDPATKRLDSP